jgi:hypothetical protein
MDLHNNIKAVRALSPVAAGTNNTAYVSEVLDTTGFASNELVIMIGANTDVNVTFVVLIEDGDTVSVAEGAVADADLLGTEVLASFDYGDDNETRKIGYIGHHRYIRATITPTGNNSGNIYLAAVWIQAHPRVSPQA